MPGHGPLANNKAQLAGFNGMLKAARDCMTKLIADGKSEEIYASKPFADFDAKMKASEQQSKNFMKVVYHSLKQCASYPSPPRGEGGCERSE